MRFLTIAEQVARHLHGELLMGRWSGAMPGKHQLTGELGVNHKTVEAALRQLEEEGLLVARGAGRRRLIHLPEAGITRAALRVAILSNEIEDFNDALIAALPLHLKRAGHVPVDPGKSMHDLKMDVGRIARLVKETAADAWVVVAGSREVLEWFSGRDLPAFALFGRRTGLPIAGAGPDMIAPLLAATRRMIALGHRRIVNICRRERRIPSPGTAERAFLAELVEHGIRAGDYNLPDWEETGAGLQMLLTSLFKTTPPTALIIDEAPVFAATQQFLAQRNLQVPGNVSLFCTLPDPIFALCVPAVSEIRWDSRLVSRSVLRWANHIAVGREDRRQTLFPAEFFPGGTIGRRARTTRQDDAPGNKSARLPLPQKSTLQNRGTVQNKGTGNSTVSSGGDRSRQTI